MKHHQITASMAKDIAFKLGAELNNEEAEIFADGYNAAMQSFGNSEQLNFPVAPDEIEPDDGNTFDYVDGWNACRAAMLQGKFRDLSQPVDPQVAAYEQIMLQAGNSPVIPDGYALVPVEPTDEMIEAAMNCEDVLFNSDESFCVQFGNIYEAMLAAAPKPQNIPAGKSTLTPDGWISCSEQMPAQDDWVLIYSKHGEYLAGQVQGEYVELNDGTLSWLGSALHWMPLPAPPQH